MKKCSTYFKCENGTTIIFLQRKLAKINNQINKKGSKP